MTFVFVDFTGGTRTPGPPRLEHHEQEEPRRRQRHHRIGVNPSSQTTNEEEEQKTTEEEDEKGNKTECVTALPLTLFCVEINK